MSKRVLVVDDDPVIRTLTTDCLSMLGLQVESVTCGEECLDKLSREPAPDLIFLDMMMPTMTGIDVLRTIRSTPTIQAVKVVLLSAASDAEQLLRQHEVKADACLGKPFQMKQLSEILARFS